MLFENTFFKDIGTLIMGEFVALVMTVVLKLCEYIFFTDTENQFMASFTTESMKFLNILIFLEIMLMRIMADTWKNFVQEEAWIKCGWRRSLHQLCFKMKLRSNVVCVPFYIGMFNFK